MIKVSLILQFTLFIFTKAISSFEECAAAGFPIMESYPEQCATDDGQTFTHIISQECQEWEGVTECDIDYYFIVCGENGEEYTNECEACINNQNYFYIIGGCSLTNEINSFQKCAELGYPVMDSYPAQCDVPNVGTFTQSIPEMCSDELMSSEFCEEELVCGDNGVTYGDPCSACQSGQIDTYQFGQCQQGSHSSDINNFQECVIAGYPVMFSYPEQCVTDSGQIFTNDQQQTNADTTSVSSCSDELKSAEVCPTIYSPVCGDDQVTYGNMCEACSIGQVNYASEGECNSYIDYDDYGQIYSFEECVQEGNPILESYPAQCVTQDGQVFIENVPLECEQYFMEPDCEEELFEPVCGEDFNTYGNPCLACQEVLQYTQGGCQNDISSQAYSEQENYSDYTYVWEDCLFTSSSIQCSSVLVDVCGDNGHTYDNDCYACTSGEIDKFVYGDCEMLRIGAGSQLNVFYSLCLMLVIFTAL